MPETNAMATVSLHYWGGARAAAGVAEETIEAATVAEALEIAKRRRTDPRFDRVLAVSALLIDGLSAHQADLQAMLSNPVQVDVLPPFAGGSLLRPCVGTPEQGVPGVPAASVLCASSRGSRPDPPC